MFKIRSPERSLAVTNINQQIRAIFGEIPELCGSISIRDKDIPLAVSHLDIDAEQLTFVEKKDEIDKSPDYTGWRIDYSKLYERNLRRQACLAQTELNPKPVLTQGMVSYFEEEFEMRYTYDNGLAFAILAPNAQFEFNLDTLARQIQSIHFQIADLAYPQRAILAEASYHYDEHDQKYGAFLALGSRPEINQYQEDLLNEEDARKHLYDQGVGIEIGALSGVEMTDQRNDSLISRTLVGAKATPLTDTPYSFRVVRKSGMVWGEGRLIFSREDKSSSWSLMIPEWIKRGSFFDKFTNNPESLVEEFPVRFIVKEKGPEN